MTHTTESMMALAEAYRHSTLGAGGKIHGVLQSAITELVEQLDIQAGSIEAVQAANVRLAAERDLLDQLNDSLKSDVQRAYKDRDALHASWEAHFGARSFGEVLAERDADKKYIRELEDAVTPELVALRAERDALAADAARIDWLESSKESHGFCHIGYGEYRHYAFQAKGYDNVRGVIDAAMKGPAP